MPTSWSPPLPSAALDWLANAFGLEPRVLGDESTPEIDHAAVVHGDGMGLIASERP